MDNAIASGESAELTLLYTNRDLKNPSADAHIGEKVEFNIATDRRTGQQTARNVHIVRERLEGIVVSVKGT